MAAPTSALTFNELILETAIFLGMAYYGSSGTDAPLIPTDAHDLAECKRIVNNGIRMFFGDAPPTGWRFARPTMEFDLFGEIGVVAANTVSGGAYDSANDETLITATIATFFPGMEYRPLVITTNGTFKMKRYVSTTTMFVIGDASAVSAKTYAYVNTGNFTLPANFSGVHTGDITYVADTNQGVSLSWISEAKIRQWRENITDETGDPYWAAVRPMEDSDARLARRWELVVYPKSVETLSILFQYQLHFDTLTAVTDSPPVPFNHDETIRQACLAVAERDNEDMSSSHHQDKYDRNLLKSYSIDSRTGPRRLGYFGNPVSPTGNMIETFRNNWYDRPAVSYHP